MATKTQNSVNRWKIVSLIFIALFAVLLIVTLVRFRHPGPEMTPATPEQIESAKSTVTQQLQASGYNNYKIEAASELGHMGDARKPVIRVTAENDTSRQFFLVDVETGRIVMHDLSERHEWMAEMKPPRESPGGFFRGKPR
jgi:uncharacterized protein YpmB